MGTKTYSRFKSKNLLELDLNQQNMIKHTKTEAYGVPIFVDSIEVESNVSNSYPSPNWLFSEYKMLLIPISSDFLGKKVVKTLAYTEDLD